MKTMIAHIHVDGLGGSTSVEFEVEDDASEEEIEVAAHEAAMEMIDIWSEET